jgi:acetolactate synthase-1/2/3 large subunit
MIVFENGGYASIRVSQKAYFEGNYIGCDKETGVGLPDWKTTFDSYGIPSEEIHGLIRNNPRAIDLLTKPGPGALIVHINIDQPFLPKVTSSIFPDGSMRSNPIHLMNPTLPEELATKVFHFLPVELRSR